MRKIAVIAAVAFQLIVLVLMAGQREYVLASGETVYLRTAPIDPRDPFRGDFVRLNYELSRIGPQQLRAGLQMEQLKKGMPVYAVLKQDPQTGLATLDYLTEQQPEDTLFMRGRVRYTWNRVEVKYGIEAYFVEQGKGLELEKRRGQRGDIQVPMEMAVALGSNGIAVLKGHRWSDLGIAIEIQRDREQQTLNIALSLKNVSTRPLAILDLPNHCMLFLESVQWSDEHREPAANNCADISISDEHVLTLQPGQEKTWTLDMTAPRWQVLDKGQPVAITTLNNEQFRLVYRLPEAGRLAGLTQQQSLWQGSLLSQAFSGLGRID